MSRHAANPLGLSTAETNDRLHGRPMRGDATIWHAPAHELKPAGSDVPPRDAGLTHDDGAITGKV